MNTPDQSVIPSVMTIETLQAALADQLGALDAGPADDAIALQDCPALAGWLTALERMIDEADALIERIGRMYGPTGAGEDARIAIARIRRTITRLRMREPMALRRTG